MIEEGLITYLLAQSAITDVVSTRIRFDIAEQNLPKPYIVVKTDSYSGNIHSGAETALAETNLSVECYATSPKEARDLSDLVRLEVSGYQGQWGSEEVRLCELLTINSISIPPLSGDEVGSPGFAVDLNVHHEITAASF